MQSPQKIKYDLAIKNAKEYVEQMSKWTDKRLEKHLDLFRIQKEMALKQKKMEAFDLLCLYEDQVILARLSKLK